MERRSIQCYHQIHRNKVRHKILPVLKEINPHILETFKNTLENLNESQDLIRDRIADITAKIMSIENDIMKFDIRSSIRFQIKRLICIKRFTSTGSQNGVM